MRFELDLFFGFGLLFRGESVVRMVCCVLKEWRARNGSGMRLELGSWVGRCRVLLVSVLCEYRYCFRMRLWQGGGNFDRVGG